MAGTAPWRACVAVLGLGAVVSLAAGCNNGQKTLGGPDDEPAASTGSATSAPGSTTASPPPPSASSPGSSRITGDPRSPITWKVRRPGGADVAAVLHAYQAYLRATTQLKGKPARNSPLIPRVATGQAQSQLAASVGALAEAHQQVYGPITAYPEVTGADPASGTATVLDCPNFSRFLLGGKATGPTQLRRPLKATLSNASGSWKVDTYVKTDMRACIGVQ